LFLFFVRFFASERRLTQSLRSWFGSRLSVTERRSIDVRHDSFILVVRFLFPPHGRQLDQNAAAAAQGVPALQPVVRICLYPIWRLFFVCLFCMKFLFLLFASISLCDADERDTAESSTKNRVDWSFLFFGFTKIHLSLSS
jgi:hypothetical protein